jgi:hypothetical protein
VPLLFTLAHKSAFESALALSRDVLAGCIHAPRRSLLDALVSGGSSAARRGFEVPQASFRMFHSSSIESSLVANVSGLATHGNRGDESSLGWSQVKLTHIYICVWRTFATVFAQTFRAC